MAKLIAIGRLHAAAHPQETVGLLQLWAVGCSSSGSSLSKIINQSSNGSSAHLQARGFSTSPSNRKQEKQDKLIELQRDLPAIHVKKFPNVNQLALKRGTGGRSSFNGIVACVFGAAGISGFVGRSLCNKLGKTGSQLILPYRGDHSYVRRLKLAGDLGAVNFLPFHLKDEDSIRKAVKYANVVINLIGKDNETPNFTWEEVHVHGPRRIARIAKEMGVPRLIHVSALNSTPNPEPHIVKTGSGFLRSKYWGELAVREEFPEVTIFRPADIFGQTDRFTMRFAEVFRRQFYKVPLWKMGRGVFKQPVFVNDVAQGIHNAIYDEDSVGKTYDCLGPKRYEFEHIVRYINQVIQKDEQYGYYIKDMRFAPYFLLKVKAYEFFRRVYPWITMDQIERENITDMPGEGNLRLEDLGVQLTPFEERCRFDLEWKRRLAHYEDKLGEFPPPPYPPTVPPL